MKHSYDIRCAAFETESLYSLVLLESKTSESSKYYLPLLIFL